MGKIKETAYLAGGCFWCTEAVFKKLKGVLSATPGYSGGNIENPTYEQVSSGMTGHAETAKIEFNPDVLSFENLLAVFFETHDPTTINRQGNDVGPQYRSIIFYTTANQKETAERYIEKLKNDKIYENPVVTEIRQFEKFYEAENYHKNYYERHKNQPYCKIIIAPKLEKLDKQFGKFLK